jgi:outer membrane protein OmpA-like peptidoglycan-associated protein
MLQRYAQPIDESATSNILQEMSKRLIQIMIFLSLTSVLFAQEKLDNRQDGVYWISNHDTVDGKIVINDFFPFVYFQKGQSSLAANFKDSLSFLKDWTQGSIYKVAVQGFCRPDENKSLAKTRARAVYNYLVSIGIPDSMLLIKDMQQEQKLWTNLLVINHAKEYYFPKTITFNNNYIASFEKEKGEAAKMLLQLVTLSYTNKK